MDVRRLELPGGRVLVLRPVRAADAPALLELYRRLDEDDVYRRFFSGRPPPASFVEKMARRNERGGFGMVATMASPGQPATIVAEASYAPLPDGDAELGITVDNGARGWLGPYILDILVEEAGREGIPNLQAEVLATNRRMQALLEARGSAVLDYEDCPATVRLCIGTSQRRPVWPEAHSRPRLLIESPGGRWRALKEARRGGFDVIACPGNRRLSRCPALDGHPCPLAAGADVIVDALPAPAGRSQLEAHRGLHKGIPVCVAFKDEGEDPAPHIASSDSVTHVVELLQGLAVPVETQVTFDPSAT